METLKFIIATRLKQKIESSQASGFTLIEILVALVIALLVITPLLGLAVNLLDTDRKEQAKATSEQEIQAAADFIARDLQQAIFIYDPNTGLARDNNSGTPTLSGIRNQIPPGSGNFAGCTSANCVPVLAFWKRRRVPDAVANDSGGANNLGTNCRTANEAQQLENCDDTFVYSLVVYYLIRGGNNEIWSQAARIGRFEIADGVRNLRGRLEPEERSRKKRNTGFKLFDLTQTAPNLSDKMNSWVRVASSNYAATSDSAIDVNNPGPTSPAEMEILIDYIDRTEANNAEAQKRFQACPIDLDANNQNRWSQTQLSTVPIPSPGFYVCVNSEKNIARVFLRGNALARIQPSVPNYTNEGLEKASSYFPTTTTEVRGVGELRQ